MDVQTAKRLMQELEAERQAEALTEEERRRDAQQRQDSLSRLLGAVDDDLAQRTLREICEGGKA